MILMLYINYTYDWSTYTNVDYIPCGRLGQHGGGKVWTLDHLKNLRPLYPLTTLHVA